MQDRRACLLVAKVLMPVAADMVLGRKEQYLEPLNGLLADAREMMRAYLLSVSEVSVEKGMQGRGRSGLALPAARPPCTSRLTRATCHGVPPSDPSRTCDTSPDR